MSDIMTSATKAVGKIAAAIGADPPKVGMNLNECSAQASDDPRVAVFDAAQDLCINDETAQTLLKALEDARRAVFVWYSGSDFWRKIYGRLYAFNDGDARKKTLGPDTWYLADVIAGHLCTMVYHEHRIVVLVRLDDGRQEPAVSDEEALGALDGID